MYWLIDNAPIWFMLLGIIGLGFGAAWWLHGRSNFLIGVAVALGLIALLWLLTRLVMTDRKQLDFIVHEMAEAAVAGKTEVFLKHLAIDFDYQGQKRQTIAEKITKATKNYQVYDIYISAFEVEELKENLAKVFFRATVRSRLDSSPQMIACRGYFLKEDGRWQLKETRFYNPVVNQQITLPID